jgi:hypothetical protein
MSGNLEEPDAPGSAGRLHAHGLDEFRPRVEFLVRDPHGFGRDAARDELVRALHDLGGIEQRDVDVEIEPRLVGRDVPAGHGRDDDAGHHVQRGVQAHECVAPIPVDLEADGFADFRQRRAGGDDMRDSAGRLTLARIRDRNAVAVVADQETRIAGLPAAERIEDRAVELDLAVAHGDDTRRRGLQVCVVSEQQFGH